jgi:hypothetical protein
MEVKEKVWLIAAVVYVLGMFPLFYLYQANPLDRFGTLITNMTYISLFGAIVLLSIYIWIGAWGEGPKEEDL